MSASPVPILLVEDDDIDVEAVRRALISVKVPNPLHIASDGVEALEMLRGGEDREPVRQPCLVLLDLNLPRMNGFELLEEMRRDAVMRRNVVLVFSTSSRPEDKAAAYDLNAAGYFLKDNMQGMADVLKAYLSINEFR